MASHAAPPTSAVIVLGPGPRLATLARCLRQGDGSSVPVLADLADGFQRSWAEGALLVLDVADVPVDDLGLLRRLRHRVPGLRVLWTAAASDLARLGGVVDAADLVRPWPLDVTQLPGMGDDGSGGAGTSGAETAGARATHSSPASPGSAGASQRAGGASSCAGASDARDAAERAATVPSANPLPHPFAERLGSGSANGPADGPADGPANGPGVGPGVGPASPHESAPQPWAIAPPRRPELDPDLARIEAILAGLGADAVLPRGPGSTLPAALLGAGDRAPAARPAPPHGPMDPDPDARGGTSRSVEGFAGDLDGGFEGDLPDLDDWEELEELPETGPPQRPSAFQWPGIVRAAPSERSLGGSPVGAPSGPAAPVAGFRTAPRRREDPRDLGALDEPLLSAEELAAFFAPDPPAVDPPAPDPTTAGPAVPTPPPPIPTAARAEEPTPSVLPRWYRDQVADLADLVQRAELALHTATPSGEAAPGAALDPARGELARLRQFARTLALVAAPPAPGTARIDLPVLVEECLASLAQARGTSSAPEGLGRPRFLFRSEGGLAVQGDKGLLVAALDAVLQTAAACGGPGDVVRTEVVRTDFGVAEVRVDLPEGRLAGLDPARLLEPYALRTRLPEIGANALAAAGGILVGHGGDLTAGRGGRGRLVFALRLPATPA